MLVALGVVAFVLLLVFLARGVLAGVLLELFGDIAGFVGQLSLAIGQFARVGVALGFALDALLLLDDLVDSLQVLADALLFGLDALGAILAEQQLQQLGQIVAHFALVLHDGRQPLLLQELDERLELVVDVALLALRHGLAQ